MPGRKNERAAIPYVYIILGVDENEHDQVIGVFKHFDEAQLWCRRELAESATWYDIWIEKHQIM